jgi:predicted nucleic acid-binding protein
MARGELGRARESGEAFFGEQLARLHFLSREEIYRAWILFRQRASNGWSFTDCTSHVVMGSLGIRQTVALDDHFRETGAIVVLPSAQTRFYLQCHNLP